MATGAGNAGWQPLSEPKRSGAAAFLVTPFTRLARAHAATVAGDTLITLALADSLFLSIDPDAARSKVALYLALTMAPFAVVAPLIGPTLDRVKGGRRWMVIGANALRALLCVLMIRDLDSLLLFPEAFCVLVLSKSYHVAKSAIVPTVVRSDSELIEANSKLSFLSGVITFATAIPAGIAAVIAQSQGVLVLAVVACALAAALGFHIPATQIAADDTSQTERNELRGGGIVLAASAMGLMRGVVGFLTFLVAFYLRSTGAAAWEFGFVLGASGVGSLLGALVAPALRRAEVAEERIVQIVLGITTAAAVLAAWTGGLVAAAGLAFCVGVSAASAKLAFDSVVQRDAPDANRGRSFAKFETRFQLTWVVGAFVPVILTIPVRVGFVVVAVCAGFALFSYLAGLRALSRGQLPARRSKPLVRRISAEVARRRGKGEQKATGPDGAVQAPQPSAPPPPPPPPPFYDRAADVDATDVDATSTDGDGKSDRGPTSADGGPGRDRTVIIDPTQLQ
ncbi:MAG TPA: MFS transporter [Acidimicrobiales bacterium]|nr:MFS transporter [Acidimicrobiales bacterium]